jgi:drug/metabolite transporter (DMT)-like permease
LSVCSAFFYALMGLCQRELSKGCDAVWVNCLQASVSVLVFGVFLTSRAWQGRSAWPSGKTMLGLMGLGMLTQLGGTSYQWSLGVLGLAVGIAIQMGVMLASAGVLGWALLGERISRSGLAAIGLIALSVLLMSWGAGGGGEAGAAGPVPSSGWHGLGRVVLGLGAACFAGVAMAVMMVGIRKAACGDTAPEAIVFFISVMGILFLGPWVWGRLGWSGILATAPRDFALMLGVGLCNLLAFLLFTRALRLATVVRTNIIISGLNSVLTVAAGLTLFAEPRTPTVLLGLGLSLVGIVLINLPDPRK